MVRDDRLADDIHVYHVAEMEEVDGIQRNTEVRPVHADDVYGLLRYLQCLHDLQSIVAAGPQSVREVLLHVLGVIRRPVIHIHLCRPYL